DYLARRVFILHLDGYPLPNRILVGEVETRKGFIDYDNAGSFGFLLLREKSSFEQRDSHRAEVACGCYTRVGSRLLGFRSRFRAAFYGETCGSDDSGERQEVDGPG